MLDRLSFRVASLAVAVILITNVVESGRAVAADVVTVRKSIGLQRGLCVVVGKGSGQLAIDLASKSELVILTLLNGRAEADRTRKLADAAGLLGTRVYVEQRPGNRIPLADNLVDAVILTNATDIPRAEVMRVVHPGGKMIVGGKVTIRPERKAAGVWSHPYHGPDNNPQSEDKIARGPFLTQFLATPYYGPMPQVTVSAGGRLFKAFGYVAYKRREWPMLAKLIAMNGYNGTVLWERNLAPGFMIHRNTIIATPDTLYLADNESCKLIDAATGKLRDEIKIPKGTGDGPGWKWMAIKDGVLFALVGKKDLIDTVLRGDRKKSGWPWSGMGKAYSQKVYPWGFGKTLLAIDLKTKKTVWTHTSKEPIDSRALCMNSGSIFLYSDQKFLKSLESKTGKLQWTTSATDVLEAIGTNRRAQNPREGYSSSVFVKCNEKALFFAGPQRTKLVAVSANDGNLLWQHGHGNFQIILRDNAVYAMGRTESSKKFDAMTGKILGDLECFRGNCTRATGTVDAIFARGHRHTGTMLYSTEKKTHHRLPAMRPACQDGVIAANGLLYWGPWMCDCNHSLVGVISLGPAGNFDFAQHATNVARLQKRAAFGGDVVKITPADWPTYRRNNKRTAQTPVAIAGDVQLRWTYRPQAAVTPTAPVTVGGTTFIAGSNGIVRAIDSQSGKVKWSAYTGGPVKYPPTIWRGRVFVGSADGYIYSFAADDGRQLWRFRASPIDRRIPVYGTLSSTWPVTSGVLVENGIAYAAAGIANHDGTHAYALDAITGKLKWQNNTSGHLMSQEKDAVAGVSVQGHMLLNNGTLYMAGGNVVSPAKYDAKSGKCLNGLTDEWQRAPRGSELFLAAGKVRVIDRMMYSPREYIPSWYYGKYLVEASSGEMVIQGTESAMMRVALTPGNDGKPKLIWKNERFLETAGVVLCKNTVLAVGRLKPIAKDGEPQTVLAAINPADGKLKWQHRLPAPVKSWGIAVDRNGRILITLIDGRVLCFGQ